ncbi:MAG: hypothetical protein ACRD4I_04635 [Candidatus Angelobacter sp.]
MRQFALADGIAFAGYPGSSCLIAAGCYFFAIPALGNPIHGS